MHFSLRCPVGLTPVLAQPFQSSQLQASMIQQTPQAGPSSNRTKHATQRNIDKENETNKETEIINKTRHEINKPFWMIQKDALRKKFPDGWNPPKKISRPSMNLLKTLYKTNPEQFSLPVLSEKFKISPEAVRRILRSKWEPTSDSNLKGQPGATSSTSQSSDGWVHHEKSETDRIPLNLAQAIQSSPPSFKSRSSPVFKNQFKHQQNNERIPNNETSTRRFNNDSIGSELGSAFQQKSFNKK